MISIVAARGARADHRAEVGAATIFRPVRIVDAVVDGSFDRRERDFLGQTGGDDPSRLLSDRG